MPDPNPEQNSSIETTRGNPSSGITGQSEWAVNRVRATTLFGVLASVCMLILVRESFVTAFANGEFLSAFGSLIITGVVVGMVWLFATALAAGLFGVKLDAEEVNRACLRQGYSDTLAVRNVLWRLLVKTLGKDTVEENRERQGPLQSVLTERVITTKDCAQSEEISLAEGQRIVQVFQNNTWGSVDDLSERCSVQSVYRAESEKFVNERIQFEDEELTKEIPCSTQEVIKISTHFPEGAANDRGSYVPDSRENTTVDFPLRETERRVNCPDCGGDGQIPCKKCGGWGKKKCWYCGGTGRSKDKHWDKCRRCRGRGTKSCSSCDSNGNIGCSLCDEKGEFWKIEFIRRHYIFEKDISYDSPDVPAKLLKDIEGVKSKTEEYELGEKEVQNKTDFYQIETTIVEYTYGSESYKLYKVGSKAIKTIDYPKNSVRKSLPYVVVGGAVMLIVVSLIVYISNIRLW